MPERQKDKKMTDGNMNTGTKAVSLVLMGNELTAIISDARWLLIVISVCVVADFRYGWGESHKRYNIAKERGDNIEMHEYKWRTSRALRRTVNKLVDYFIWVCLGMLVGWAILRPLGIDYMLGGIAATAVAVGCEAKSFIGHFFYLHGIRIEQKSVGGFLKAFVVAFAKKKNADIGEALEDAFDNNNDNDNNNKEIKR